MGSITLYELGFLISLCVIIWQCVRFNLVSLQEVTIVIHIITTPCCEFDAGVSKRNVMIAAHPANLNGDNYVTKGPLFKFRPSMRTLMTQ